MDWERPVDIELFEPVGSLTYSGSAGMRINGSNSRNIPMKSFEFRFRREYGSKTMKYPLFPNDGIAQYESFVLRNSGEDLAASLIRDPLAHELGMKIGLDGTSWRPAYVFLNGHFWGVYQLRERADRGYFATHQKIDPEQLDLVKNETIALEGDTLEYDSLVQWLLQSNPTSESFLSTIRTRIDLENYNDWLATELYANNSTWPGNNILDWRERKTGALWRWILNDFDTSFEAIPNRPPGFRDSITRVFERLDLADANGGEESRSFLFARRLAANAEWRRLFLNRFSDLLNSTFAPTPVETKIRTMTAGLDPAIELQVIRWGNFSSPFPYFTSLGAWKTNVNQLISFAQSRPSEVRQRLGELNGLFGTKGTSPVVLSLPSNGFQELRLNSLRFTAAQLPWTGIYFSGVPVDVTAIPQVGWRLSGWVGRAETTATLTVDPISALTLTPQFEKIPVATSITLTTPGFNGTGQFIVVAHGMANKSYTLLSSLDIQHWEIVKGATADSTGTVTFLHDTRQAPLRFYQVRTFE